MKTQPRIWLRFDLADDGWRKGPARFNPALELKDWTAFCRAEEQFVKALNKAEVVFPRRKAK